MHSRDPMVRMQITRRNRQRSQMSQRQISSAVISFFKSLTRFGKDKSQQMTTLHLSTASNAVAASVGLKCNQQSRQQQSATWRSVIRLISLLRTISEWKNCSTTKKSKNRLQEAHPLQHLVDRKSTDTAFHPQSVSANKQQLWTTTSPQNISIGCFLHHHLGLKSTLLHLKTRCSRRRLHGAMNLCRHVQQTTRHHTQLKNPF